MPGPLSIVKSGGPVVPFGLAALAGLCAVILAGGLLPSVDPLRVQLWGGGAFAVAASVALFGMARSYPHGVPGLCNIVTLARLGLACLLVGALVSGASAQWLVFAIAGLAFALDGVDGYLARRSGLSSDFGARFDMEVDSALALTLAALAYSSEAAGVYVLLLGLPRYAFGLAQVFLPWLNRPLPPRFTRKVVCVIQIAALLVMVFPLAGSPFTDTLAALAALALVWSFWRDIAWLRAEATA
ncbi:CDP-alcohol phosphatidyltransferase family protein [Gymnodinialimonas ulvae]|uniref:CDP-alcohol phosphatidyltransferase family protein n=1 Tax=Gymnodinialimonas ulvae TaxID=3126504 RepID=UPI0030AAFDED